MLTNDASDKLYKIWKEQAPPEGVKLSGEDDASLALSLGRGGVGLSSPSFRAETSEEYWKESLELLEEVQLTGAIFFPYRWLQATFRAYRSDKLHGL